MRITLKIAVEEDCDLIFKWANDAMVRENAFRSEQIQYTAHKSWFRERINSSDTKIFIGYIGEKPIGQIRIDFNQEVGVIDYSIHSSLRGKGYGTILLIEVASAIKENKLPINKLIGRVKVTNKASQKAFISAGYIEKCHSNYIEYSREIL